LVAKAAQALAAASDKALTTETLATTTKAALCAVQSTKTRIALTAETAKVAAVKTTSTESAVETTSTSTPSTESAIDTASTSTTSTESAVDTTSGSTIRSAAVSGLVVEPAVLLLRGLRRRCTLARSSRSWCRAGRDRTAVLTTILSTVLSTVLSTILPAVQAADCRAAVCCSAILATKEAVCRRAAELPTRSELAAELTTCLTPKTIEPTAELALSTSSAKLILATETTKSTSTVKLALTAEATGSTKLTLAAHAARTSAKPTLATHATRTSAKLVTITSKPALPADAGTKLVAGATELSAAVVPAKLFGKATTSGGKWELGVNVVERGRDGDESGDSRELHSVELMTEEEEEDEEVACGWLDLSWTGKIRE
jgi:hypothetical protein